MDLSGSVLGTERKTGESYIEENDHVGEVELLLEGIELGKGQDVFVLAVHLVDEEVVPLADRFLRGLLIARRLFIPRVGGIEFLSSISVVAAGLEKGGVWGREVTAS